MASYNVALSLLNSAESPDLFWSKMLSLQNVCQIHVCRRTVREGYVYSQWQDRENDLHDTPALR